MKKLFKNKLAGMDTASKTVCVVALGIAAFGLTLAIGSSLFK